MSTCPSCGGPPMLAGSYNVASGQYDKPVECPHVCPSRADRGDFKLCLCCLACTGVCKRERPAP